LKEKDQKFKADIIGPAHEADASPPCRPWPARPTRSVFGKPTHNTTLFMEHLFGFAPTAASRHREERSDPLMIDLSKICFQKTDKLIFANENGH
jgi:hypothetical protein